MHSIGGGKGVGAKLNLVDSIVERMEVFLAVHSDKINRFPESSLCTKQHAALRGSSTV